ncbi:hypothetical protein HOY80DRAFT_1084781 [Tuber brumale]|nr:hypothetical protein HOY80DRAFT_1084781 [Tuber brumale]
MSSVGLIRIFSPSHGIVVEITNAGGPAKTLIAVMEKNHTDGGYVKTNKIRMSGKKEILIDLIEERIILYKGSPHPWHSGTLSPETSSVVIRGRLMKDRRIGEIRKLKSRRNDCIFFGFGFCLSPPLSMAVQWVCIRNTKSFPQGAHSGNPSGDAHAT